MEENENNKVIVVVDDIFFASKIREAAKPLSIDLEFVKNKYQLFEKLNFYIPSLIIVDLNYKSASPIEIIKELKSSDLLKEIPTLGYLSHVKTDLKKEAEEAGYDLVLPKSRFSREVRKILREYSIQN